MQRAVLFELMWRELRVNFEMIDVSNDGAVMTITLNRPDRLNAAPPQMFDEMAHALETLGDARALLITGAGRAFCSGADLSAGGSEGVSGGDAAFDALTRSYNPTMLKLSRLSIPIVSAVKGPAAGIGCSLALAADFVVVGRSAYFLQSFVNIGLVPDGGASWMLARLIGKARAAEMMMLGERIDGAKAVEWGLAYRCADDDAVMDEARAIATRLATGPTRALGLIRQGLADALDGDYATALQREAENQRTAGGTADAVEGRRAFLEKRKAAFKGR